MTHSHPQSDSHDQYSHYYPRKNATNAYQDFAPRRRVAQPPARPSPGAPYPAAAGRAPRSLHSYPAASPPSQPGRRQPRVTRRANRRSPRKFLLAGGSMLALAALVVGPKPIVDRADQRTGEKAVCQETVQEKSVLSRAELSELLAIDERAPKADVQAVIAEPYCTLSPVEVREGVMAQREAYPLEVNPETWFVVLYEGEEYAGIDFRFSR